MQSCMKSAMEALCRPLEGMMPARRNEAGPASRSVRKSRSVQLEGLNELERLGAGLGPDDGEIGHALALGVEGVGTADAGPVLHSGKPVAQCLGVRARLAHALRHQQ